MPNDLAKPLYDALYRARAEFTAITGKCSEFGGTCHHTGELMGFQQIDRMAIAAVEDCDRALIEHEQTNIFDLWHCKVCGDYELPNEFNDPEMHMCHHQPMQKVQVERIS